MAIARVVSFEGVDGERIQELKQQIETGDQPEGLDASEVMILHDPGDQSSLAIVLFDSEDDYRRGDEILESMPSEGTPGRRTSVKRYDVAVRQTG